MNCFWSSSTLLTLLIPTKTENVFLFVTNHQFGQSVLQHSVGKKEFLCTLSKKKKGNLILEFVRSLN